jgi:hypothetical protein
MKYLLYQTIFFFLIIISCKNVETAGGSNSCNLTGRFFNMTVLDQCPSKMPVDVPYYALELIFRTKDSVDISNGIEKYRLPVAKGKGDCQFKILNATQFGDMLFEVKGDSLLLLYDTAWTKVVSTSSFVKLSNSAREDWSFENYLNNCAIAGSYTITSADGKSSPVYFLPNGQVSGIKPYLSYELCYAGDCLEETETPTPLIEFMDDKGERVLFAYKKPEGQSSIQFFNIGEPKPDVKGGRSIEALAFELKQGVSQD